ncbi:DNA-3-methyladenine glycosylase 2 family protein [Streptomyces alkaliphilus]|uniref:DNA-3-methyladenine glycosylase 2 family protein n=1 Tax=Streptomyces alkaliphilus TaxID=1472722 RepID=A0A7W3TFG8_9ACTN|nr:DNA-3-methyladenine glycosylase 2 family protein [Streptomyces alkaliphilus]MBB0245857.1 DNA-3-methyladenine glycosylase 2 family protein [Streptomyces alkaliphilus]
MAERTWRPDGPYDMRRSLEVMGRGARDPALMALRDGTVWRASRTPEGPASVRLRQTPAPAGAGRGDGPAGEVVATAWGPGAEWLLRRLPDLLGAGDRPDDFVPRHAPVADVWRRHRGVRLIRTGLVMESLIPSVLEQKITVEEAFRSWRRLLLRFGEPAPGPAGVVPEGLRVMPDRRTWSLIPSWEWHRAGVDAKRSATILRAVRLAPRLEEAGAMPLDLAIRRLCAVPGVGPWTAAETLQRSNGEPDAVTVGDLHLPSQVGWTLAGEREADDARMLALLEPYAGQRYRATRLIRMAGRRPPRREPRRRHWDIARL